MMTRLINADGRDVTTETIGAIRKVVSGTGVGLDGTLDDLRKANQTINLSNNLVAYDLEAPSKTLYPVLTPLRNRIPRVARTAGAGDAVHWKSVTAIAGGSSMPAMAWVPESQRAPRMTVVTEDKSATYVTIGLETDVSFEAQSAGRGFEDVMATSGTRLLQQTMILEEYAILAGNRSVALGTPTTPTLSASGSGATLPAATYSVGVIALTHEGYLQTAVDETGVRREQTITGMDGKAYTLNDGSSKKSALATQAVTSGQTLFCSTAAIKGAVAYAWYVGTAGNERLEAITTINSVAFSVPFAGTEQTWAVITDGTTDRSRNASLAFDGLLYSSLNASNAYYLALDTGTAGTGTPLTASSRGTIVEIDTMLKWYWDKWRMSPDEIYVNAQELTNIYNKVLISGSNPLVRFMIDGPDKGSLTFTAGQVVGYYMNPYTLNGGQIIPIRLHPNLAPGTIFAWTQNLPAYYQSSNVPQVAQMQCRRDYYQIPWVITTRANETGVYSEEVLKVYFPPAIGIITNIGDG